MYKFICYWQEEQCKFNFPILQVAALQGVVGVQETNFWTLCTNQYVGGVKLEVRHDADPKYVTTYAQLIFREAGVNHVYIQLDYEQRQQNDYSNGYKNLQSPHYHWPNIKTLWRQWSYSILKVIKRSFSQKKQCTIDVTFQANREWLEIKISSYLFQAHILCCIYNGLTLRWC